MTRVDEPCDSDLCIGQLVPLLQQAIRASGVACHPAQTATFPTHSLSTQASAANRLANAINYVACGTVEAVSNQQR